MSYIQDNLMPGEKILYAASVHPAVFLPGIAIGIMSIGWVIFSFSLLASTPDAVNEGNILAGSFSLFFAGIIFITSIFAILKALIILLTTEFAVTNRKVIAKTGLLRRRTLEILLSKVESVAINQSILGRMINYGTVTVVGTGGTRETFRSIKDPIAVRNKINLTVEQYMQAYSEHQQQRITNQQTGR